MPHLDLEIGYTRNFCLLHSVSDCATPEDKGQMCIGKKLTYSVSSNRTGSLGGTANSPGVPADTGGKQSVEDQLVPKSDGAVILRLTVRMDGDIPLLFRFCMFLRPLYRFFSMFLQVFSRYSTP